MVFLEQPGRRQHHRSRPAGPTGEAVPATSAATLRSANPAAVCISDVTCFKRLRRVASSFQHGTLTAGRRWLRIVSGVFTPAIAVVLGQASSINDDAVRIVLGSSVVRWYRRAQTLAPRHICTSPHPPPPPPPPPPTAPPPPPPPRPTSAEFATVLPSTKCSRLSAEGQRHAASHTIPKATFYNTAVMVARSCRVSPDAAGQWHPPAHSCRGLGVRFFGRRDRSSGSPIR